METKLLTHLERLGLGVPVLGVNDPSEITVRAILNSLLSYQGGLWYIFLYDDNAVFALLSHTHIAY